MFALYNLIDLDSQHNSPISNIRALMETIWISALLDREMWASDRLPNARISNEDTLFSVTFCTRAAGSKCKSSTQTARILLAISKTYPHPDIEDEKHNFLVYEFLRWWFKAFCLVWTMKNCSRLLWLKANDSRFLLLFFVKTVTTITRLFLYHLACRKPLANFSLHGNLFDDSILYGTAKWPTTRNNLSSNCNVSYTAWFFSGTKILILI